MAARGAVLLIRGYQLVLSPLLGPNCRFQPTCSQYALEAVRLHGGLKGSWLAIRRVMRCHPWGGHGYDPVTPRGVTGHKKTPKGGHAGKQGRPARENN
ncbi:membrane protein insertion efficiency factor YidD [Eilatimonas milleporae]|uniref:membrane protein insertion efficiency factor YidD n=1 Tax=Eilatimonas milleporae TaxID=911205 RepID=UPI000EF9B28D